MIALLPVSSLGASVTKHCHNEREQQPSPTLPTNVALSVPKARMGRIARLPRAIRTGFLKWNPVAHDALKTSQIHQRQRETFKPTGKIVQSRSLSLKRDLPKSSWRSGSDPAVGRHLLAIRRRSNARAASIFSSRLALLLSRTPAARELCSRQRKIAITWSYLPISARTK
jgi:hypothetical protein